MHNYLIPVVCLFSSTVIAEGIYHWVDDEGKRHYGDTYTPGAKPLELSADKPNVEQVEIYRASQQALKKVLAQQAADRRAREGQRALEAEKLSRSRLKDQQQCTRLRDRLAEVKAQWDAKRRRGYLAEDKRSFISRRKQLREQISGSCG